MTEFFYDYSCFIHYCCCLTFLTRWTYFYFELQISSITMHNGQTLVALKFMRSYEQFSCELRSRDSMNLQRDHVVGIIAHYGSGAVEDMNYMHQVRTCTRSLTCEDFAKNRGMETEKCCSCSFLFQSKHLNFSFYFSSFLPVTSPSCHLCVLI